MDLLFGLLKKRFIRDIRLTGMKLIMLPPITHHQL